MGDEKDSRTNKVEIKPIRVTLMVAMVIIGALTWKLLDGMFTFLDKFSSEAVQGFDYAVVGAIAGSIILLLGISYSGLGQVLAALGKDDPAPPEPSVPLSAHKEALDKIPSRS